MYVEITQEVFNNLVPNDLPCESVDDGELAKRTYYFTKGVRLQQLDNYTSFVTQYFIQDINA